MSSVYDIYVETRKLIGLLKTGGHENWALELEGAMGGAMASEILGDIMIVLDELRSSETIPTEATSIQKQLAMEIQKVLRRPRSG